MGAKVTIDSATLMNKGLELLEAMSLFAVPPEKIQILIHRESIMHSGVEYVDRGVIAQLGAPDMRLPIQYALTWPDRRTGPIRALDLFSCGSLTFAPPDTETFRCLALAIQAAKTGGTAPTVLNGANEVAVDAFLREKIGFLDIERVVETALDQVPSESLTSFDGVFQADRLARAAAKDAVDAIVG
jgi:1-deoxy-D-xylulose-5-phosphate reductoisomerase